jgi:HK97 family phage portal protein
MTHRQALKAATVPAWLMDEMVNGSQKKSTVQDEHESYDKVPIIYRAVRLRCNALTRVPVYVYPGDSEEPLDEAEYPFQGSLPINKHLWLAEASLLLKGASFTLILKNAMEQSTGELQFLNPFTMSVILDRAGEISRFEQGKDGGQKQTWPVDDILYWQEYDPTDSKTGSTSAAGVSLGSAQMRHYLGRFSSEFFEKGAMPVMIVGLPTGTQQAERERVESFFKKTLQGIKNAFRIVAVSGEVKPTILTPAMNTLAVPDLSAYTREDIAYAFDIPETVLSSKAASYATASSDYRSFLEQTIVPRCWYYEEAFNKYLKEQGYRIEFAPDEMSEMQEDENQRATAFKTYVDGGMTPELASEILGIDVPENFKGEMFKKQLAPIINVPPVVPKDQPKDMTQAKDEMKKWEKKSLKRLKEGKSAQVEFESDALPESLRTVMYNALGIARSEEDVRAIFNG